MLAPRTVVPSPPTSLPGATRMITINQTARVRFALVFFGAMLVACFGLASGAARAQSGGSVIWDRYDVEIDVQDDGTFQVTERMEVTFSGSHEYTFGYAEIPLDRVEEITNVAVRIGEGTDDDVTMSAARLVSPSEYEREPGTYKAVDTGANMDIEYAFAPISNGSITVELTYDALGALRVYTDEDPPNQQIYWIAISDDVTAIGPIRAASVTIHLPEAVALADVVLGEDSPGPAAERTTDGQTWSWESAGLVEGDDLVVRMQFPPITSATEPSWQDRDDADRQEKAD